jgi:hypothetical protein
MEQVAVGEPFDRRDVLAGDRGRKRQEREHTAAFDVNRARPHCPWSQPFFEPVNWRCSRSASSSVTRGSIRRAAVDRERDLASVLGPGRRAGWIGG